MKLRRYKSHSLESFLNQIDQACADLAPMLEDYKRRQNEIMPTVRDLDLDSQACEEQDVELYLPSSFNAISRVRLGLDHLVEAEMDLRRGQANDALENIREICRRAYAMKREKYDSARGVAANTRARKQLDDVRHYKLTFISQYNAARAAMVSLGMDKDSQDYLPLTEADTTMRDLMTAHTLCAEPEGWIWRMAGQRADTKEEAAYILEGKDSSIDYVSIDKSDGISSGAKVRWFRYVAECDRWAEEINILTAELHRCLKYYQKMVCVWNRSAMWVAMATRCQERNL